MSNVHETGTTPRFGDEPARGAQPGHAAEARGDPDGAARIGAERARHESGGRGDAAAAARPARDPGRVPGVPGRAEVRARGARAERELVRVELPDDDRPGRPERRDRVGVALRDAVGQDPRGGGRPGARDVDHVLDADRHAPERSALARALERRGLGERLLRAHRDEAVQPAVERLDPAEGGVDRLARRQLAGRKRAERGRPGSEVGLQRQRAFELAELGRIPRRKPATASRSASSGSTPRAAACARSASSEGTSASTGQCYRVAHVPIYGSTARSCKQRFEELVASSEAPSVRCPSCGSKEIERVWSTFATEWKPSNVNWHRLQTRSGW